MDNIINEEEYESIISIIKNMANTAIENRDRNTTRKLIYYSCRLNETQVKQLFVFITNFNIFDNVGYLQAEVLLRSFYKFKNNIPEWYILVDQVRNAAIKRNYDPQKIFIGMEL